MADGRRKLAVVVLALIVLVGCSPSGSTEGGNDPKTGNPRVKELERFGVFRYVTVDGMTCLLWFNEVGGHYGSDSGITCDWTTRGQS